MELCLQMAIIFVGKQFLLSFVEYQLPRLWKLYNSFKVSPACSALYCASSDLICSKFVAPVQYFTSTHSCFLLRPVKSEWREQHLGTLLGCIKKVCTVFLSGLWYVDVVSLPIQWSNTGLQMRNMKCEILMQLGNAPNVCSRHSDLKGLSWLKVMTGIAKEERGGRRTPQWIHDFKLADFGDQGLFYEYLEMSEWVNQITMVTLYVHVIAISLPVTGKSLNFVDFFFMLYSWFAGRRGPKWAEQQSENRRTWDFCQWLIVAPHFLAQSSNTASSPSSCLPSRWRRSSRSSTTSSSWEAIQ